MSGPSPAKTRWQDAGERRIGGDGLNEQVLLFLAELDAPDHAEADFFEGQAEFVASGLRVTGLEAPGIDSVVNDVDGRDGSLLFEQARHFIGDGDEGVREFEKMSAEEIPQWHRGVRPFPRWNAARGYN